MAEKNKVQRKKFYTEKIFDFEIFVLKYVSKHSESIPTKKIFRPKFFDLVIFHYFGHFGRKKQSPMKKFYMGKIFRFRDFRFKIRFETFGIDSDQKKFSTKIF